MDCLSDDVALPVGSGPSILLPMSDLVATFPELMERKTRGSSLSWTEAISLREPSPKLRLVLELFAAQRRIFDAQTLPLLKEIGHQLGVQSRPDGDRQRVHHHGNDTDTIQ